MILLEPSVKKIYETNPVKLIELAGRTCYKSEDKMTDTSSVKFVKAMMNSHHYAMLEHGHITCKVCGLPEYALSSEFLSTPYLVWSFYNQEFYITLSVSHIAQGISNECTMLDKTIFKGISELFKRRYIEMEDIDSIGLGTTSLPGILIRLMMPKDFSILPVTIRSKHTFESFRFICDRAVSHELVRHRCSVAQESQRYCNYGLDKFDNQVQFIYPCDWETLSASSKQRFIDTCEFCENQYLEDIADGIKPQMARHNLPNSTKTEVVLTMSISQWVHFIKLRSQGVTGSPHPDMKLLAEEVEYAVVKIIEQW